MTQLINNNIASCFIFSLPKAGSSLVNQMVRDLGHHVGVQYRSIMDEFFSQGIKDSDIPVGTAQIFKATGHIYGGFRYLPPKIDIPLLKTCKKIFLVRDPRDLLTSWYFSVRDSHILPGAALQSQSSEFRGQFLQAREKARSLDINDWVVKQSQGLIELLLSYKEIFEDSSTRIFRYEDVIFNKPVWALDIAKHFGWDIPASTCAEVALRHDVRVGKEEPGKHIRNVTPGDYKRKLSPKTICELNYRLRPVLEAFRYADSSVYFPAAIELLRTHIKETSSCTFVERVSADLAHSMNNDELCEAANGCLVDDGSVECVAYWAEGSNNQKKLIEGTPFTICYILFFHKALTDVVLGVSAYHKVRDEQFGRNTSEFGPLSYEAGAYILVRWAFSNLPYAGEYLASVGVSSYAVPERFNFRQFRMWRFMASEPAVHKVMSEL